MSFGTGCRHSENGLSYAYDINKIQKLIQYSLSLSMQL